MMSDLIRMQQLLQGGTLSDAEVASLRQCVDAISRDARLSVRRIGRTFALLCETFASVDSEHLPPELRAEIETIALGRDLPETDTSGPVTPMDLLQIATRLAAMGDRADAARLRRLADDLVSKPVTSFEVGCIGIAMTALREVKGDMVYKDLPTTKIDEAIDTIESLISRIMPEPALSCAYASRGINTVCRTRFGHKCDCGTSTAGRDA
jgi:hypothetical protein